jgi:hypothetical protein
MGPALAVALHSDPELDSRFRTGLMQSRQLPRLHVQRVSTPIELRIRQDGMRPRIAHYPGPSTAGAVRYLRTELIEEHLKLSRAIRLAG